MRFAPRAAAAIAAFSINALSIGASSSTCGECQPNTGYLVTRLWNIKPGTTDQEVIDEFNSGFAPKVTRMDGFYRYTAALTGNSTTVFFMNIFDTIDHAHDAQEAAKLFVDGGSLNGKIYPNSFTEDAILAQFSSPECVTSSAVGEYLATRENEHAAQTLYDGGMDSWIQGNNFFKNIPGYRLYLGSIANDNSSSFFLNIYETALGAQEANDLILEQNAKQNHTMGTIAPVTNGEIMFDYLCAAGNAPEAPVKDNNDPNKSEEKGMGGEPSSAFTFNVYAVAVYGAVIALKAGLLFY